MARRGDASEPGDGMARFGVSMAPSLLRRFDEHNCLEVIVMPGPGRQLRQLAQRLLSLRGVKHGRLLTTGSSD